MKRHYIVLLSVLLVAAAANAQRLNVAYVFSTGVDPARWITLDSSARSLMSAGDARSQVTDIGFTFNYAGTNHTKFSVNKYGYLRLGNSSVSTNSYPSPLGSGAGNVAPGVVTIPRYSNTMIDPACHARYRVVGDTGDRVLVVEMRIKTINVAAHDTGFALFQVQLHEATDAVRIVYGDGLRPATNYQVGFAGSNNDVAFIDVDSNLLHYANTTTQTNDTNAVPEQWRWYQITRDTDYCYHYAVPWSENFNTDHHMACWTMLDYDASTYTRWVRNSGAMWAYRDNLPCNDWMVTPLVQLPDSGDGLQLMYDYKATSLYDYGEMEVRLAAYAPGDTSRIVDTLDFFTLLRTENEGTDNLFQPRGISLSAYAGMCVRIAFVHVRLHSHSNIYVDNVQIVRTTAPSVSINAPARAFAHDTTEVHAMLLTGSKHGLTYSWQSTMVNSGLAQMSYIDTQLTIIYTHYGTDTVTCIVSNIYGTDTSQVIVDVRDCTTVTEYPWIEDFEHGLDCWHQLGGWSATYSHGSYEGSTALRSNSSQSSLESPTSSFWIMSQPFALPDTATLPMPELLWWMHTPSQDQYSNNQFSVRIAVVDSNEIPPVASFITVYSQTLYYGDWKHYRVSLEDYAGQNIRIMLHNVPSHSGYGYYDCALIDQVEVRSTALPVVKLNAPPRVEQLDSNTFTAHLEEGDTAGLTFTWHSTMASSGMASFTAVDTMLNITYTASGTDTLTIIATNRHGSGTATAIVSVNNCPALQVPIIIDFEDSTDLDCWSGFTANGNNNARISDINPWYRTGSGTDHYMNSNADRGWLVTPAIDLPHDMTDLYIHWYQHGSNRLGVFISTDSNNYFEPADFSITLQSFSDELSYTNGHHCYSLAAFAGQRIRIGFVNAYDNIQLDNIRIAPVSLSLAMTAPDTVRTHDTAMFSAHLLAGDTTGLTYTWQSKMTDAGLAAMIASDSLCSVVYGTSGLDTVILTATNAFGTDSRVAIVQVVADTQDVGIMRIADADGELLLMPNPAKGTVSVTLPAEGGELSVIDMWGRQVWSSINCTSPITIGLNGWHSGMYLVHYTCSNVQRVVRLVVE